MLWFNLDVTTEVINLINLTGRLIATLNNNTSALWNDKLTYVNVLCWLNVNEVVFVYGISCVEWHTTNLAHLLANILNNFAVSSLLICDELDIREWR